MRLLLAICVLLLLASAESHAARTVEGVVQAVYDGDTVLLVTRESSQIKARLYGIDAPETAKPDKPGQPFGDAAKRTLRSKILGKRVSAEIVDVDQYQRAVAVIRYAGRDINREMVAEGLAWAYRQYLQGPYTSEYLSAESSARSGRYGLWRDANPQPPWEFRKLLNGGRGLGRYSW
jgi:micrococcal nuclease